ncbi:MAG TPA: nucleotide exchange factor GrpE [Firmicutes bacterium]|mgnify:CR=1 FL=1|nr:nucleotide exchange factor GrpE [Bacillota bacterium]HHT42325.1 nucleotide exchange factor GrpE [Bacillota bacterium]
MTERDEKVEETEEAAEEVVEEAAEGAQVVEQDTSEWMEQVGQLEREKAQLAQQLLRLKADFENFRRRTNNQLENIRLEANEELLKDLLPVLDNFERALQSKRDDQDQDPFFQGMELVHKGLQSALANHGLRPIEAVGQPFDPNLHEAVAMHGAGGDELWVLAQVQTGYLLYDKVLRHTKVLVGQSEEEESQCQK